MKEKCKKEKKYYMINIFLIALILLIAIPSIISLADSATINNFKNAPNIGNSVYITFGRDYRIYWSKK